MYLHVDRLVNKSSHAESAVFRAEAEFFTTCTLWCLQKVLHVCKKGWIYISILALLVYSPLLTTTIFSPVSLKDFSSNPSPPFLLYRLSSQTIRIAYYIMSIPLL